MEGENNVEKDEYMKVCKILNEVLDELEREYASANTEWGTLDLVKGRGITEKERIHLHQYRVRMNELFK